MIKLDSTLRGNLGPPIDALLDYGGGQAALICPAFPEMARTVIDGRLLVDGVPVADTAARFDPVTPVQNSRIASVIAQQTRRKVAELGLPDIDSGVDHVVARVRELMSAGVSIVVADAAADQHLATLVQATEICGELVIGGSAGIARQLTRALGRERHPATQGRADAGPALAVVGSLHPRSIAQAAQLGELPGWGTVMLDLDGTFASPDRWPAKRDRLLSVMTETAVGVVLTTSAELREARITGAHTEITNRLADLAANAADALGAGTLILTGGETAYAVMTRLGIDHLDVSGELAPGVPSSRATTSDGTEWQVITKAGGFGEADALTAVIAQLETESGVQ
jgi:uncharacterized protein YgbK (DUF1537 family)